ncbi:MAG TPA: c-type cytochrome [Candidatus Binatia bacterium]|nr:c-type cytochrome [Candidatus Binatia bacterium]
MKHLMIALLLLMIAAAGLTVVWTLRAGVSARREPSAIERYVASRLRHLAIPASARERVNPLPASPDVIKEGREHFADHCAICHANDGSGDTEIGHGLYPKPPDMRKDRTQSLSDGELFYIIQNGVRFTGMPAWGSDPEAHEEHGESHDEDDNWELVHFIRHLPKLSPGELDEMERLNPKSPQEAEEERAEQEFLEGGAPQAHSPEHAHGL